MRKMFGTLLLSLVISATLAASAYAAPVLGGKLYSLGGNVQVEVLEASAGYDSELHLFTGGNTYIATNREIGKIVDLGTFAMGTELLFGIYVRNTGNTFYMGQGSRNADGLEHATVDFLGTGVANVGFEDLYNGGDRDYNDNMFQFRGAISENPVPEPATMLLLGSGLVGLVGFKKKTSL